MLQTILLTRRWPESVETQLSELGNVILNNDDEPFSEAQLVDALSCADIVCPTVTDRLTADVFAAAQVQTRLLANFGVGFNHIDMDAAAKAGIAVTNTPGVLTDATAEIALTLMLMSARRTGEGERHLRQGHWQGWRPTHMLSTQVTGKTLGIIGMGRIGIALARKAHHGLGMHINYYSRSPIAQSVELELRAKQMPLEEVLASSDFISLHCPATPATHHLIGAEELARMPEHAHLINTARGDVVDETALLDALRSGEIAGAGLDVYEQEPHLTPGLAELEQVVLLPHMGSGTRETRIAMGECALANVRAFIAGNELPNRIC
jgi:lactate dehydrogenase-like 2-hydroxyacid dehydrogenase